MELKQIKELMAAMGRTGMMKLSLEQGDFKLTLEREGDEKVIIEPSAYPSRQFAHEAELLSRADLAFAKGASVSTSPAVAPRGLNSLQQQQNGLDTEERNAPSDREESPSRTQLVKSPMVGTFYLAPSPDEPPFVKIGQEIDESYVICIVEAMKVMNEIKAGVEGVVEEILVENGHPVEFGTPLFKIKLA